MQHVLFLGASGALAIPLGDARTVIVTAHCQAERVVRVTQWLKAGREVPNGYVSFRLSLCTARNSASSTIQHEMQPTLLHVERARTSGVQPDAQVSCPHGSTRSST